MSIRAVLWDADGVLQDVPRGWQRSMEPAVGHLVDDVPAFLEAAFAAERPALVGRVRWVEALADLLAEWGIAEAYEQALNVWLTIEPCQEAHEVLAKVRRAGTPCYLASNQDEHRARYMIENLGYRDLVDGTFFSYELGVAKPDPAFFGSVAAGLSLAPNEIAFVDDNVDNIAAAAQSGFEAFQWSTERPIGDLVSWLTSRGIACVQGSSPG